MWQRFTESARRAVYFAQEETKQRGERAVSPEHILLGLIHDEQSIAVQVLYRLEVAPVELRQWLLERMSSPENETGPVEDLQLDRRATKIIDLAYDEARRHFKHNYIGSEHLLLALLREKDGLADQCLSHFGVTQSRIFTALDRIRRIDQDEFSAPEESEETGPPYPGDLGVIHSPHNHAVIEAALDADTFAQLQDILRAKDIHGYRALLQGVQTLFLLPVGTPIKLLIPSQKARIPGYFIRVLAGEYEGYAGWIQREQFQRTGPDESPFPPVDITA